MTREKLFSKRVRARRLKAYPELTALGIGWGASLIIGLLLLAGCYDRETGLRLGGGALFAALYLFAGALCLVLYIAARIRVAAGGGIPLRRLGYLAILTAFTGNVFAAIAGFSIIREKRSLEYELCYYALLNDLLVMLISLLNYFKDVLAAYFYVGIGLLAATVVLYLAALVAIERAQASGHYRRLAPLAVVLIETVEPYAEGYRDCVARAVAEAREGARPALKAYPSLDGYDTVFLGYPNWCGTMPMAVFTFLERHDWSGKRICPFCTNEGSGLGKSEADLRAACPGARVERGLSVHGAEAAQAGPQVAAWVKGLL